ncbi:PREDICTED: putative SCAN domain-containing protein SCAND2P, partial [Chinchilla lanigera]|uniref:putative SCAN domain-containing protein SCAND2P n=1 Tax=Chinchilla lanigera TaxID=34839 RepID=UPI0006991A5A
AALASRSAARAGPSAAAGSATNGARTDRGRRGRGEGPWSRGAGPRESRRPRRGPRSRAAQPRPGGSVPRCRPAQAPSMLTPPPASRRHSPNRNRLPGRGVSGRAERKTREPPRTGTASQHRKRARRLPSRHRRPR